DPNAARALIASAERLLEGEWRVFGVQCSQLGPDPDWFTDPRTGRRAPERTYCFHIDHRAEQTVGNIKYVWELSRHHHLTVLASAYYLTRDERYARRVAEHLTSWWRENPFLSGVHWTSGIEVAIRLIAWVWVRRLLDGWPGAAGLFEENPLALRQLHDHQRYVATLHSHGSSANNHLVAEAAGLFAAACAVPWFEESAAWRTRAAGILRREIARQTFECGLNREMATDYHGFVLELALAAALEGEAAGVSLGAETWARLRRMTDAVASMVDVAMRAPRQGDSDDASGLLLGDPAYDRWGALLGTGAVLFGALDWWPRREGADVRTTLWTALATAPRDLPGGRPALRRSLFEDAGMVILRDRGLTDDEIWCRCDHGPLGFLSLAAHGHAAALSIEVRYGGVDVLADPGTYCYHGEPRWRAYFRSTLGHNTLEVDGENQSVDGGAFMWLRHARARLLAAEGLDAGHVASWEAEHDGYARLDAPAIHRRTVALDRERRTLGIVDALQSAGAHDCRLAFHLGDTVDCTLVGSEAELRWPARDGTTRSARLTLPA
ncbi:MAG TPA: alginate lyase family protein, partial [Gemmatirosa sp.]